MTVSAIINELHAKGIELRHEDGQLKLKAPKGALTDDIREQLISNKPGIIAFLKEISATNQTPPIPAVNQQPAYDLSHAQKRLWLIDQLIDKSGVYNVPQIKTYRSLDTLAFRKALELLFKRHEILRTTFHMIEGVPKQVIQNSNDFELELNERKIDSEQLDQILLEESFYALDLSSSATRASLLEDQQGNYTLVLIFHHIVIDHWSLPILNRDFKALYEFSRFGTPVNLPDLGIQYKDYAHWQNCCLENGQLNDSKEYWKNQLAGDLPSLELPLDNPRSTVKKYSGAGLSFELDRDKVEGLAQIGYDVDATLYMVLTGAVNVLLHKYTDQTDIVLGSPIVGRDHPELENQIGFYTNTIVIRALINTTESFIEFLSGLRETILESYEHQFYPFDVLIEDLSLKHELNRNPLFDVMISYQDMYKPGSGSADAVVASTEITEFDYGVNKIDLSFTFVHQASGILLININYNKALFKKSKMLRLVNHLQTLLTNLVENPNQKIKDIGILSRQGRAVILQEFSGTRCANYNLGTSVKELLEQYAEKHPDHIALLSESGEMSFGELHEKSNQLARALKNRYSLCKSDRVALLMTGSFERIIAIVAAIKLGTAYIPIDIEFSDERIEHILDDSAPRLILADNSEKNRLRALRLDCAVEYVPQILPSITKLSTSNLNVDVEPGDLFIILFTSGSTGKPKGVLLNNLGLVNRTESVWRNFSIGQESIIYQKTNYVFDVSLSEFLLSFCYGAKLLVATGHYGRELIDNIIKHDVTHIWFSPTILNRLIDQYNPQKESISTLQYVFASGEELQSGTVKNYYSKLCAPLINQYGPTESSIDVTSKEVSASDRLISIGKPISNIKLYILDQSGDLMPIGIPGEIGIGGIGLADGYLNRQELTASKFVVDRFEPKIGGRIYMTGDIGYWNESGEIEFLGRRDNQINLWGARIELGEIECAISSHPAIEEAAASVYTDSSGNSHLIGYYIESAINEEDVTGIPKPESDHELASNYSQHQHLERLYPGTVDSQVVANRGLCESLDEAIKRQPHACALSSPAEDLTYEKLGNQINNLAWLLRNHNDIQLGDLVGIMLDRSIKSVVSMFAVLKVGAAYVPIDPSFPQERVSFVIENAAVKSVIVDYESKQGIEHLDVTSINYDANHAKIVGDLFPEVHHDSEPHDLSYVCYTSGTSGRPKGVMVERHSVTDYVNTFIQYYKIGHDDIVVQQASMSFDTVVEEIFPILFSGGKLVILSDGGADIEAMIEAINTNKVTVLSTTPLVIDELNQRVSDLTHFPRIVISGGEELRSSQIDNLIDKVNIFNTYGPTEATVCISFSQVIDCVSPITLGSPIANHEIILVNENMEIVASGEPGEILVKGPGVARGYINNLAETNKRFIAHPSSKGVFYKTGDLAKWNTEGELIYLGRNDDQVKIRGYRVEMTEVSKVAESCAGVVRAVTLSISDDNGLKHLVCYFVAGTDFDLDELVTILSNTLPQYMVPRNLVEVDEFARTVSGKIDVSQLPIIEFSESNNTLNLQLKTYLKKKLPNYMIPARLVRLETLPLTATGKIDRVALARKNEELAFQKNIIRPGTELEKKLLEIWKSSLKVDEISVDDNLFEVGGNSLSAARIVSSVYNHTQHSLSLKDVFNNPTIQELAQLIEGGREDKSLLLNLNTSENREKKFFLIPPVLGSSTIFSALAKHLSALGSIYGLQCRGFDRGSDFDRSIEDMARSFVKEITSAHCDTELTLFGYSMGVPIAYEMTKLLEVQGYYVDLVFLDRGVDRSPLNDSLVVDGRLVRRTLDNELKNWPEDMRHENLDRLNNLLKNNLIALSQYRESGSVSSNIVAFEATGNMRATGMRRWQDHTTGTVEHRYLEGDHYDVLSLRNIEIIAQSLTELLSEENFLKF